LTTIRPK